MAMTQLSETAALSHKELMDTLDEFIESTRSMTYNDPGVVIGSSNAAAVKIGATTKYTVHGTYYSKNSAEVGFTATAHDIPANATTTQEACYLLCLDKDGNGSLVMGPIATGAGNAVWPNRPPHTCAVGGVRVAVNPGATPFDASTDLLSASHITDTYYSFGVYMRRFSTPFNPPTL